MKRKSSIHIEQGKLGYLFHNDRTKPTANSIFSQENNEYDNDATTAIEIYRQELQKRSEIYTKRTGKNLHKNTITHLSAIVNLDERHTLQDVKKIADYLEQELGTKVFQIAIHRDEGYVDEQTGEKHINYHAHLEFLGLDKQGNSVRRKLDRKFLINLQDKVAEILQMQRGINYTKERKKRPKRLDTYEYKEHARRKAQKEKELFAKIEAKKTEHKEILDYLSALAKKHNYIYKPILNNYEAIEFIKFLSQTNLVKAILLEKESLEAQVKRYSVIIDQLEQNNRQLEKDIEIRDVRVKNLERENYFLKQDLAKVKDLKEENKKLREQLKEAGAEREHYAQLEQFVKELKKQVKSKELTIEQLKEQFAQKEQELLEQIKELKQENSEKDATIEQLKEQVIKLQDKNNTLADAIAGKDMQIEQLQEEINRQQSEKEEKLLNKLQKSKKQNKILQELIEDLQDEKQELKKQIEKLQNAPKPEPIVKTEVKEKIVYREDTERIEQLQKQLEEQKRKNAEIYKLLRAREEEIAELRAQLQELKQLRYIERKKHEDEIKELKERIKELEKEQAKTESIKLIKKIERMQELSKLIIDFNREDWKDLNREWQKLHKELEKEGIRFIGKQEQEEKPQIRQQRQQQPRIRPKF